MGQHNGSVIFSVFKFVKFSIRPSFAITAGFWHPSTIFPVIVVHDFINLVIIYKSKCVFNTILYIIFHTVILVTFPINVDRIPIISDPLGPSVQIVQPMDHVIIIETYSFNLISGNLQSVLFFRYLALVSTLYGYNIFGSLLVIKQSYLPILKRCLLVL